MQTTLNQETKQELEEKVIQIDRVTRVVKGGRRLRFRAIIVVGDKNGRVGVGVEKGSEVIQAIEKATAKAKKDMIKINLNRTTIPHEITSEFAGAKVFLKPARKGTGVIAGGAVRAVLEAAGVQDVLSKIQGSSSKLNNVYATMQALKNLNKPKNSEKSETKKVNKAKVKTIKKPTTKSNSKPASKTKKEKK